MNGRNTQPTKNYSLSTTKESEDEPSENSLDSSENSSEDEPPKKSFNSSENSLNFIKIFLILIKTELDYWRRF